MREDSEDDLQLCLQIVQFLLIPCLNRTIMRYKADLHTQSILEELEKAKGEYSRAVKDDPVPYSFSFMLELVRALPGKFYETMMETPNSGTLSMSNIPGPKDPLKMFGKNVKDRMIWLPLSMNNSGKFLLNKCR
jgi:hypothetical protein